MSNRVDAVLLIEEYWQALKKHDMVTVIIALDVIIETKLDDKFISLSDINWQIDFNYKFEKAHMKEKVE